VDNGSSSVQQGEVAKPDLRLRVSYQDFVDIIGERVDPLRLLARGRLRPKGSPLAIKRLTQVFPRG
jgi:putative sterol carrier protein